MEAKLTINGVDFAKWAQESGISQAPVMRQERSITTLDGTLHSTWIEKRQITFTAVELRSNTLAVLTSALLPNPATVYYTDEIVGNTTGTFYITDVSATTKTVIGGNTYYEGFALTLEER